MSYASWSRVIACPEALPRCCGHHPILWPRTCCRAPAVSAGGCLQPGNSKSREQLLFEGGVGWELHPGDSRRAAACHGRAATKHVFGAFVLCN